MGNSESFKNFSKNAEKRISNLLLFEYYEIEFLIEIFITLAVIYKR